VYNNVIRTCLPHTTGTGASVQAAYLRWPSA